MMKGKIQILLISACMIILSTSVWARTIMVSYDLIVQLPAEMAGNRRISEMSIDLESGVMDELFDRGHIVFNSPGLVYSSDDELPGELEQQGNLAQRRLEASSGGADMLVYLRLFFDGESEDDLELSTLECEVYAIRNDSGQLASEVISYQRPGSPPVNGHEASTILMNRLSGADLF